MNVQLLRKLRKEAGLNQAELGERIGVSASTIGMYEQGRRNPDHETLIRLSEIFKVTVDSLLGAREQEKAKPIDKGEITAEILKNLKQQEGLMFSAKDMSAEDYEKIQNAIELAVEIAVKKQSIK